MVGNSQSNRLSRIEVCQFMSSRTPTWSQRSKMKEKGSKRPSQTPRWDLRLIARIISTLREERLTWRPRSIESIRARRLEEDRTAGEKRSTASVSMETVAMMGRSNAKEAATMAGPVSIVMCLWLMTSKWEV